MPRPLQPVLVLPVYRGGEKFQRALDSVRRSEQYFRRIVVSLNGPSASTDSTTMSAYLAQASSKVEVIQTGNELPWMEHQYFWLEYLERSGETSRDWILWFAHDDQLRHAGMHAIVDIDGNWPLVPQTIYIGPWGMRLDPVDGMYDGPPGDPLESWTSFPLEGPLRLPVAEWIAQQVVQPTYINMSGTITQLASFQAMRGFRVSKPGGMRIEMATAAAPNNLFAEELPEPVMITHTSAGSDRTKYSKVARKDDVHMALWLANYIARHPGAALPSSRAAVKLAGGYVRVLLNRGDLAVEDWRRRTVVDP